MKTIKVKVNGREVEALLIENVKSRIRKKSVNNKEYYWEERYIFISLPKFLWDKQLAIVPLS